MKMILEKLKQSRLCKRVLKVGIAYIALELVVALGVILFVAEKATT